MSWRQPWNDSPWKGTVVSGYRTPADQARLVEQYEFEHQPAVWRGMTLVERRFAKTLVEIRDLPETWGPDR